MTLGWTFVQPFKLQHSSSRSELHYNWNPLLHTVNLVNNCEIRWWAASLEFTTFSPKPLRASLASGGCCTAAHLLFLVLLFPPAAEKSGFLLLHCRRLCHETRVSNLHGRSEEKHANTHLGCGTPGQGLLLPDNKHTALLGTGGVCIP